MYILVNAIYGRIWAGVVGRWLGKLGIGVPWWVFVGRMVV